MTNNIVILIAIVTISIIYGFLIIFNKTVSNIQLFKLPSSIDVNIALCISGEVRDISHIHTFISQQIRPYKHCDVFMHVSFRDSSVRECYIRALKPVVLIESSMKGLPVVDIVYRRIYELHHAAKEYSKKHSIKYDLYVRTRPDIILSKPIPDKDLHMSLNGKLGCTMILSTLYVLGIANYVSDTYFIATEQIMDQLVRIYEYIAENNISQTCDSPEALLYEWIRVIRIPIHYIQSEVSLTDYTLNGNTKGMIKMVSKIKDIPLGRSRSCIIAVAER